MERGTPGDSSLRPEAITSKEIAAELLISYRTVENHRANICQKLELKGSHSLIKFAFDHKSQIS